MSSGADANVSFTCPQCQKRLKAPPAFSGKRVECPRCKTKVMVPAPIQDEGDADAWLALDGLPEPSLSEKQPARTPAPPNQQPARPIQKPSPAIQKPALPNQKPRPAAKPEEPSLPPVSGRSQPSIFDDDLPELAAMADAGFPSSAPITSGIEAALEQLALSDGSMQEHFRLPEDEEFSFPCKVCGTLLYVAMSRVGSMTRCPDCHSEISVPSPKIKKKPAKMPMQQESGPEVRLSPVQGTNPRQPQAESAQTKQILEKAAREMEREREELDPVATSFDSKRWLSMIFGYLRDPGVIIVAGTLGIFAAVCFYALHAIGSLELSPLQISFIRGAVFIVLGIPLLVSILLGCLAIIPMAANRKTRVEDWPFARLGDSIGEAMMGGVAIFVGAIPGGILASILAAVGAPVIFSEILTLVSIWGLTPILLLGMIDNNSITQPISKTVWKSLSAKPDAWGAMYFQTALAMTLLFVIYVMGILSGPAYSAAFGFVLPVMVFFIANQYGLLAGRISDVTDLGYDGDFSEDEVNT